jgi:hypothetical protein
VISIEIDVNGGIKLVTISSMRPLRINFFKRTSWFWWFLGKRACERIPYTAELFQGFNSKKTKLGTNGAPFFFTTFTDRL